jgi:hypothetical protein
MRRNFFTMATGAATLALVYTPCSADIVGFTDRDEWEQAVGAFTTIDFTGFEPLTLITDQYADLGVLFTDENDVTVHSWDVFVNDGEGLEGSNFDDQITVEFDLPHLWFAVDHAGSAFIDVYDDDIFLGTFEHFAGGAGKFTGIVSDLAFNKIVIHRGGDSPPFIDDLHFGIPAPGAIAVLALAGLLGTGSRRRRG